MIKYRPITQSQWWVQCASFSHYFTTFSGIKDTAGTSQYADGSNNRIYQLKGPRTLSEVTISTPFDPVRHADVVDFWKQSGCGFLTLTVTPIDCNGENPQRLTGARQIIMPEAQITAITFGQADKTSSNVSMLELNFVLDSFQYV